MIPEPYIVSYYVKERFISKMLQVPLKKYMYARVYYLAWLMKGFKAEKKMSKTSGNCGDI